MGFPLGTYCSCGALTGSCACEHDFDEDCMNCTICGECSESVDDNDVCSVCRFTAETLGSELGNA